MAMIRHRIDVPTLAAIAALVGVVSTQAHEGLGHGGMCLAEGLHLNAWGAFYVDCGSETDPLFARKLVEMAGSTVNLIVAIVAALLFVATSPQRFTLRFILWLTATLNAFEWAGYFLFSGVGGIGDWGVGPSGVLFGVANPWAWRALMAFGGMAIYWWLAIRAMHALAGMTGDDPAGRAQAKLLSLGAYATIGVVAVLVGLLNPEGVFVVIASAGAASLGGASGLWWGINMIPRTEQAGDFELRRNWPLIVAAIVVVAAEAVILGPTLRL